MNLALLLVAVLAMGNGVIDDFAPLIAKNDLLSLKFHSEKQAGNDAPAATVWKISNIAWNLGCEGVTVEVLKGVTVFNALGRQGDCAGKDRSSVIINGKAVYFTITKIRYALCRLYDVDILKKSTGKGACFVGLSEPAGAAVSGRDGTILYYEHCGGGLVAFYESREDRDYIVNKLISDGDLSQGLDRFEAFLPLIDCASEGWTWTNQELSAKAFFKVILKSGALPDHLPGAIDREFSHLARLDMNLNRSAGDSTVALYVMSLLYTDADAAENGAPGDLRLGRARIGALKVTTEICNEILKGKRALRKGGRVVSIQDNLVVQLTAR